MKKFLLSISLISASYASTNKDELPYPRNVHIYGADGVSEASYNELKAKYEELKAQHEALIKKNEERERERSTDNSSSAHSSRVGGSDYGGDSFNPYVTFSPLLNKENSSISEKSNEESSKKEENSIEVKSEPDLSKEKEALKENGEKEKESETNALKIKKTKSFGGEIGEKVGNFIDESAGHFEEKLSGVFGKK